MKPRARQIVVLASLLGAVALVVALVHGLQHLPQGVRPVIWDKEICHECKMSISERAFAAQLQTSDGQVLGFDDPGCLFLFLASSKPAVHAIYFHALQGNAWLDRDNVAFIPTKRSPMGFGLGAVPKGSAGALTFEQAMEKVCRQQKRED